MTDQKVRSRYWNRLPNGDTLDIVGYADTARLRHEWATGHDTVELSAITVDMVIADLRKIRAEMDVPPMEGEQ